MCLEFEAEESERDSWKDTSVGVKPGAKDVSINGLCAKPTTAKGKQELYNALAGIVIEGKTGTFTFRRGKSEMRTINITAQKCNKLLSVLGAPNEVLKIVNEVSPEGHRPTYVGATDSVELTEPYVIIRATQDYGCATHANLTRIFEVPGSAEKLTSIHVLYVVMGAMSARSIDRVERQLTTILGTNPLSSSRDGIAPVKTFLGDYGHQSLVGDGKMAAYIVMPNEEFVDHCNSLFEPGGALCRNYRGIPYSGPYAGATIHQLKKMRTELRKNIGLMQPSLSAL